MRAYFAFTAFLLLIPQFSFAAVLYTNTVSDNNHSDFSANGATIEWVHACSDIMGTIDSIELEMISTGATTNIDSSFNAVSGSTEAVAGGSYVSTAFVPASPVDCTSGNITLTLQRNGGDDVWIRGDATYSDGSTITCTSGATCNGLDSFVVIVNGTTGGGSGTTTTATSTEMEHVVAIGYMFLFLTAAVLSFVLFASYLAS